VAAGKKAWLYKEVDNIFQVQDAGRDCHVKMIADVITGECN
jgi:hypothetical protein